MEDTASLQSGSGTRTSNSGIKRKRTVEPKFYAVRAGFSPGVYQTWDDCKKQITGFKGASFKSFPSLTDAERFLDGEDNPGNGAVGSAKFYAVKSGRVPGIYTDWTSAQQQIKGWTKPRHKLFQTRAEAQRFLDEDDPRASHAPEAAEADQASPLEDVNGEEAPGVTPKLPPAKKAKKAVNGTGKVLRQAATEYNEADFEPGTGPLPAGAEDGFDPNITLDTDNGKVVYKSQEQRAAFKPVNKTISSTEPVRIHTDGSSLGNGTSDAFAGIGVYFGPGDPSSRQTNQRAELTAMLRALEVVPLNRDVTIITDSKYSIDCVTSWYINWRRNGWKTSAGKAVENKDLIEGVLGKIEERQALGRKTDFEWIKGHANHLGNMEADRLANEGARKDGRS